MDQTRSCIPVEALRHEYKDPGPSRVYITSCTNDFRGMVVFLLKNHGFKATRLRGGISNWEGPRLAACRRSQNGGATRAGGPSMTGGMRWHAEKRGMRPTA